MTHTPENPREVAITSVTALQDPQGLLAHEQGFRQFADFLPHPVMIAAPDGWALWLNRSWGHYTGLPLPELSGQGWFALLPVQQSPEAYRQWKEGIASAKPFEAFFPLRSAEGTYKQFQARFQPMQDTSGDLVRWLGTFTELAQPAPPPAPLRREDLLSLVNNLQSHFFANYDIYDLFEEPLQQLLDITQSEYGFIGEVLKDEQGSPYLKCNFLTNIAWDENTKKLWEENRKTGFEFHKLDNLFGEVITTGRMVISNDPANDLRRSPDGKPTGHPPLNSFLGLPFYNQGQLTGMVGIANRREGYSEALAETLTPFLDACANIIDVYRNKQNSQRLTATIQKRETQLRAILNATPECIKIVSTSGTLEYMNASGLRMVEAGPEAIGQTCVFDVIAPEYRQDWIENHKRVCAGETLSWEFEIIGLQGARRWMETHAVPLPEEDGGYSHLAVSRDITSRKQTENALRASEARFKNRADASPHLTWELSPQGEPNYVNKAALAYVGNTFEEYVSQPWSVFLHPDDHDHVSQTILEAVSKGEGYRLEHRILGADGNYRWFISSADPSFFPNGELYRYIGSAIDIHDRKMAEEALRESEERFRILADASSVFIVMSDATGKMIFANRAVLDFAGAPAEEVLQDKWTEFVHPEDLEAHLTNHVHAITHQEGYKTELRVKRHDGEYRWLYSEVAPRFTTEGKFLGLIASNIDITDRKLAETALKESEERFRAMADASPFMIWVTNEDGQITYHNKTTLDFTGYSLDEVLNNQWLEAVHPDDLTRTKSNFLQTLQARLPYSDEFRIKRHSDGQYRWVLSMGLPRFSNQNEFLGYIGSTIDIDDRKQAEEVLNKRYEREHLIRRIVEVINRTFDLPFIMGSVAEEIGKYFEVDRAFVIRYEEIEANWNVKLFGQYYRTEDIPRVNMEDFPPDLLRLLSKDLPLTHAMSLMRLNNPQEYLSNIQERMQQNPSLSSNELGAVCNRLKAVLIDKQQTHAFLRVGIYYRGTPYGVITLHQCQNRTWTDDEVEFLQDIALQIGVAFYQTELYQQEQQARQESDEANRKKSEFLAMMSHELRTPLNAIIGYSEMMKMGISGQLNDKQQKYINNVVSSGKHLLDIVNDILDIAKAEAGKMEIFAQPLEMAPLAKEVEGMMLDVAAKHQVQLCITFPQTLPKVMGDAGRIKQILINLVNNAIKFNRPAGRVEMTFNTLGPFLRVEVKDTGEGIPPEKIPQLFSKFHQLHSGANRKQEGTGLGLALTKHLVELHGGDIWVVSEVNVGTSVFFQLPLA